VMLMTPGLALFYGGMVRRKNVLGTVMQSFVALGVISIQWVLFGYSLAFGPDIGHVIGGLQWAGLRGVGLEPNPDYAATVPHQLFMIFQMMFAVITPPLLRVHLRNGLSLRRTLCLLFYGLRSSTPRSHTGFGGLADGFIIWALSILQEGLLFTSAPEFPLLSRR